MDGITIRDATATDTPSVVRMLSAMLVDMANTGGQPVADAAAREDFFRDLVEQGLCSDDIRYVVADSARDALVGTANAAIVAAPPAFQPRTVLHISTAYVLPANRNRGIARQLVETLLAWGRTRGCTHADLNVLDGNPARGLYTRLGFRDTQRRMELEL